MNNQSTLSHRFTIESFLLFLAGLGVGICLVLLYQNAIPYLLEPDDSLPSCSSTWVTNHVNEQSLKHIRGNWYKDIQMSKPLTPDNVRTLSKSKFATTCSGTVVAIRVRGEETRTWNLDVEYETYLSDSGRQWTSISSYSATY